MTNDNSSIKPRWRFAIVAGLFLAVFASYPQFKMWYLQGSEWQGHYAYNDIDEVAYAAYLKALIDGRPRRNDPYTGRDDAPGKPQPESLFSIQFAAPYTIALPARLFGIPATWAMTLAGALAGFLTALACFWLIRMLTEDSLAALAGTLVTLCGGALLAGEGAVGELLGTGFPYPYFPFLRRYIPAMAFPAFFALTGAVWMLIRSEALKERILWCVVASVCFSYTVFSYFYVWTTAAAWLFCLALLFPLLRPKEWLKDFQGFVALGAACLVPLVFYAVMLSNRVETMDHVQLLVYTRELDLRRFPQYVALFSLFVLLIGVYFQRIGLRSRRTIFALSLALTPFILFNQQVLTGRSLQPIHYQVFIGNYVAGAALVISLGLVFLDRAEKRGKVVTAALAVVALAAVVWGFVECHYTVRVLDEANVARDEALPVGRELTRLAAGDPDRHRRTIYSLTNIHADDSPTVAPQNVLWARHQHVFAGLSWEESKERYYKQVYFRGLDEKWLGNTLRNGDFVSMIALFGWGRHTGRLSSQARPLTEGEIVAEARRYGEFIRNFGPAQAYDPQIDYVVVPTQWVRPGQEGIDLSNLDRWYRRDEGERIGAYTLYRLEPRESSATGD